MSEDQARYEIEGVNEPRSMGSAGPHRPTVCPFEAAAAYAEEKRADTSYISIEIVSEGIWVRIDNQRVDKHVAGLVGWRAMHRAAQVENPENPIVEMMDNLLRRLAMYCGRGAA